MSERPDPVGLVGGIALVALGALLLLDQAGALDLSLGWFAAAAAAVLGAVIAASGLAAGGR